MLNLEHRHSLLTSQRRRDSGISVGSLTSNVSRFSYLSTCQGGGSGAKSPSFCVTITLEVDSMRYLKSTDEYDLRLSEVSILSLDVLKRQLRCKIAASRIKHINDEHDKATETDDAEDDYVSTMLDGDVDDADRDDPDTIHCSSTARNALSASEQKQPYEAEAGRDPAQEWNEIAPKKSIHKREYRSCSIGDCDHIERLVFVLKHYAIFIKQTQQQQQQMPSSSAYVSMTAFLSTLRNYDRVKLLNDYYHTKKYHLNNESDKELVEYVAAKLVQFACTQETHACACCRRMASSSPSSSSSAGSRQAVAEIALLSYLDVIHVLLLHYGFSSGGDKFVTKVCDGDDDADGIFGGGGAGGEYDRIDYWQKTTPQFCPPTHKNLKSELLNNGVYALSSDEYARLELKCVDYQQSEIGNSLQCKREFAWMGNRVKCGEFMSLEHIMSVMIATNYAPMMKAFRNLARGGAGVGANRALSDGKHRSCSQIAHFLRLLKESVWCFGDVMSDKQRMYHGLSEKLLFSKCSLACEVPVSLTAKYSVAQKLDKNHVILKMGKVLHSHEQQNVVHFDVSNFSCFPVEKERIVFGANLGLVDVIYDGASHLESVMSLTLYQQIIAGQWLHRKNSVYFKKKYQRKIVKFIRTMIAASGNDDDDDDDDVLAMAPALLHKKTQNRKLSLTATQSHNYIQQLFESITSKNDRRGDRTVWINESECRLLLPQLAQLLFEEFVPYLAKRRIRVKYACSIELNLSVSQINDSSFRKSVYSKKYKFNVSVNGDQCSLHFRCYKKFDTHKKEEMFRGFIAAQNKLPPSVSKIEVKYGLQIAELAFHKWDECTLSNSQLYHGSSLFKMQQINHLQQLNIKVTLQVISIYDNHGNVVNLS